MAKKKLFKVKVINTWTWEFEEKAYSEEQLREKIEEGEYSLDINDADFENEVEIEEANNAG